MEVFGIVLSLPIGFVCCLLYCFLLDKLIAPRPPLSRGLWQLSLVVLVGFAVEVAFLVTLGAQRSQDLFGLAFQLANLILFVHTAPALANVLVLWPPKGLVRWYWAVPICTVMVVGLVILQYAINE